MAVFRAWQQGGKVTPRQARALTPGSLNIKCKIISKYNANHGRTCKNLILLWNNNNNNNNKTLNAAFEET